MRLTIILFAAALTLAFPVAAADEADPDCESGQPWLGYRTSMPVRGTIYNNTPITQDSLNTCEGEQWDGQDTVSDEGASCDPTVNADPSDLFVGRCLGANPNDAIGNDALNPLGVRVASDGSAVYAAANIALVGRAAVYTDGGTTAVYLRDNTEGNVLASAISALRITQGYVDETDCDQAVYQDGAMTGTPKCGRDNTAITVEQGLA